MRRKGPRNPLTGRKRRQYRHYTSRKRRDTESMTTEEAKLLTHLARYGTNYSECVDLCMLILMAMMVRPPQNLQSMQVFLERIVFPYMVTSMLLWIFTVLLDAEVGDIPEAIENAPLRYNTPKNHNRLSCFASDRACEEFTAFYTDELRQMLDLFQLPTWILVPRHRPDGRNYLFHREELLIMLLNKLTKGDPISEMAEIYGYKCDSRLGAGIRWLAQYLDDKYDYLIGPDALLRWRVKFPECAKKIRDFIARDKEQPDPVTGQVQISPGVWFNPNAFCVAGLVDCKDYDICCPHSGPAFYFPGAPRRPWWDVFQRALFCGHHHEHEVKMLTFLLPNGLYAAVWGPASARRDDARLVHWSKIDELLFNVQYVFFNGLLYCFFGDKAFIGAIWTCIRTYHDQGGNPLTNREREEDRVMKTVRQRIELNYGGMSSRFPFVNRREQFKLEKNGIHSLRMIRLAHFFWNIRCCFRGNLVSAVNSFDMSPPTPENYLAGQFD